MHSRALIVASTDKSEASMESGRPPSTDLTGKSRPESQSASWVCPNRDGVRSVLERGVDADALGQGTVRRRAEACNQAQPGSGRGEALGTDALCWGVVRGRAEACDRAYSQSEKVKVPGAEDQEELEAADSSSKDRGLMESDPKGSSKKMSTENEKPDAGLRQEQSALIPNLREHCSCG